MARSTNMKSILIFLFSIFHFFSLNAQNELNALAIHEESMKVALDSLRASKNDKNRKKWNDQFKTLFKEVLEMKEVFNYPFDSLKSVAKLQSPDKFFRIFNWNIEHDNGTFTYYAYVLVPDNETRVFELIDQSDKISEPEDKTLDHKKWYGALYYDIILSGTGARKEYTLLGWDGNNKSTGKKIIDVMIISSDKIQFGAPIFKDGKNGWKKRIVFEFSSQATFLMRFNHKLQRIEFDHLMPETPMADGIFEFYFPDGSYDAYVLEGEKWILLVDIDARREKDKRDKNFKTPKGTIPEH